ncbi:ABC transporter permease [Patescibacteria group bacterium]|nr:ABC transporter permease [Patescibacteria group bacterium]
MKFQRINALLIRHLYLMKRSFPRIMDIFFWPVMELLLWGFLSVYIQKLKIANLNIVTVLLGAIILWSLLQSAQQSISVAFLEEVWEKNLLNIFVTPLRIIEFLFSTLFLGIIKIVLVSAVLGILAALFYAFNIFQFGFSLIPFIIVLLIFGWAIGLFTMAVILRFGTSAQVLAFGFIFLIQPFSAVFYPVSALPAGVRHVSYLLPSTYVFEGMRAVMAGGLFPYHELVLASAVAGVYLVLVLFFFYKMFGWVKQRGLLMKLD